MRLGIPGSIGTAWPRISRDASSNEMDEIVKMAAAFNMAGAIPDSRQRLQHFVDE